MGMAVAFWAGGSPFECALPLAAPGSIGVLRITPHGPTRWWGWKGCDPGMGCHRMGNSGGGGPCQAMQKLLMLSNTRVHVCFWVLNILGVFWISQAVPLLAPGGGLPPAGGLPVYKRPNLSIISETRVAATHAHEGVWATACLQGAAHGQHLQPPAKQAGTTRAPLHLTGWLL